MGSLLLSQPSILPKSSQALFCLLCIFILAWYLSKQTPCQLCYIRADYFCIPWAPYRQGASAGFWERFRTICVKCIPVYASIRQTHTLQYQCQTMFNGHTHAHF